MIRIFILSLIAIFSLSFAGITTYAACGDASQLSPKDFLDSCSGDATNAVVVSQSGGKQGTLDLVKKVAERVLQFGALFAIGAIVFSGIRYTTSAGDDEKLKSAKNIGIYAIIGLILLLTAFPLVDIIVNFLYGLGTSV